MSGRTRGIRRPTPGARAPNESGAFSTLSSQNSAPSDNRSDSDEGEEQSEESIFGGDHNAVMDWSNPTNAQVVDGVVVHLAADLAKKSTAKHTKDTKWTAAMEEKLVSAVYGLKAHANTDIAKYKKSDSVKAKLVSDRDFAV